MGSYDVKNDVWVQTEEMPLNIKALCTTVGGETVIVVNSLMNAKAQRKALRHELWHVRNNDLYSDKSVEEIENAVPDV